VARREQAEERALALRAKKLVDAAGPPTRTTQLPTPPAHELTFENVGRLERESSVVSAAAGEAEPEPEAEEGTTSPTGAERGEEEEDEDEDGYINSQSGSGSENPGRQENEKKERPRLERRTQDSEMTITGARR